MIDTEVTTKMQAKDESDERTDDCNELVWMSGSLLKNETDRKESSKCGIGLKKRPSSSHRHRHEKGRYDDREGLGTKI